MARESQFTEDFKREAVRKAEASQNVSRTARELGISNKTLHAWLKQFGQAQVLDVNTATMSEMNARIRQLERAVAEKDATIQVLKKAISIVSQEKSSDTR
ncbi:MAG: transposase [Anaerolineae bacterium]|nr:transposase [Anaerolineae bacterium]